MRIYLTPLLLLFAAPVHADVQFHAHLMTNAKLPRGKAQCEIRLLVDQQVEVSLRGDTIGVRTLTGADAHDNGSECSEPLPAAVVDGFTLTVKKKQGEVRLVEAPTARNSFTATIFIHDNTPGEGLYDLRITWNTSTLPAGINSNNATHFAARGSGKAALNDAPPVVFGDAIVDIDRGGNAVATFQIGRSGSASFTGTVITWDAKVLKMDARAGERFRNLPGPMYIYFDASKQIYKIAMDATNGQDQLRVTWQRK